MAGWQAEEFGAHHEGRAVALLADGTVPKAMAYDTGTRIHRSTQWWVYDGTGRAPLATDLRAACSCGWTGTTRHPLDWTELGEHPCYAETPGPYGDWAEHVREVHGRTVPVPDVLADLLQRLDERLGDLANEAPIAALRVVAALERTAKAVGLTAACNVDADEVPWDAVAQQLGISEQEARARVFGYQCTG
jgi:hypothetical protein